MKIVKIIIIIGATSLLLWIGLLASFSIVFSSLETGIKMSDQDMITYFHDHAAQFNQLNQKIIGLQSKGLKRIDDNWTAPEDISTVGLTARDLANLRKEMANLRVPRGVNLYDEQGIEYISFTSGLATGGGAKGFYYSTTTPQNYYKDPTDLQSTPYDNYQDKKYPDNSGSYTIYVRITDNWYIYEDYDD